MQQNVEAPSLAAAPDAENRNQALNTQNDETQEALVAFREKREAVWTDA